VTDMTDTIDSSTAIEVAVNVTTKADLLVRAKESIEAGLLRNAMTALMTNDRKLAAEVSRMDNIVDGLDEAIKLYVTKLTRESLDDRDGRRATEIISFSINLEHIGDIIDKNLILLSQKVAREARTDSCKGRDSDISRWG
jgi:phosphate:Na+ symporter